LHYSIICLLSAHTFHVFNLTTLIIMEYKLVIPLYVILLIPLKLELHINYPALHTQRSTEISHCFLQYFQHVCNSLLWVIRLTEKHTKMTTEMKQRRNQSKMCSKSTISLPFFSLFTKCNSTFLE
jgi:hypothetical protein